ncbi:MAG TPA: APC family permease [Candidatus Sulfotelmatobacter sp.]|nr:APC family permease [Candidatus Sulfotelmatobacter sp.]
MTDKPTPTSSLRKAGLFYLVFVMFSYTTGGPFGLEDMVTTSGPGMTLIYLLLLPIFWCIPVSLVSAELTTAMPVEGGFYRWTRAAFGDFWGFLAGWWNWSASFLLGGAYAVLFTDYIVYYLPKMTWWEHYLFSLALIALLTWINVRGIQMVGQVATGLELFIFLPVATMIIMGLARWHHNPFHPWIVPNQPTFKVFGVGLALGLWLYSGYEQLSTVAEEVENPQKSYPLALALVVPLSVAAYFLPTFAGLASAGHWQSWHTGFFSDSARMIGGPWLGTWMTIAAMVGNVALLNSTILTTTRMPFAMAEDGYLPHFFTRKHARYGTPWLAIIASAAIYALLAWQSLGQLISVYIWLRSATTVLTVLSAWKLRRTRPELKRAFVIPGGRAGLVYVVAAPVLMAVVALLGGDRFATIGGAIAVLIGPIVYRLVRTHLKREKNRTSSGTNSDSLQTGFRNK